LRVKDLRNDPPPARLHRQGRALWQDKAPIRADLFGAERLKHHARTLAAAQPVARGRPARVLRLSARLKANAAVQLTACRASAAALDAGQAITPAAEWLLGLNRAGQVLTLAPCFPRHWPRLEASVRVGDCSFDSVIDNAAAVGTGIAKVTLDGVAQVQVNGIAALPLTGGGSHRVMLRLGPKATPPVSFG
jgi:hypothetical protein